VFKCPVKKGKFYLQLSKTSPFYFHWTQAAPTRYRDRSHCIQHAYICSIYQYCMSSPSSIFSLLFATNTIYDGQNYELRPSPRQYTPSRSDFLGRDRIKYPGQINIFQRKKNVNCIFWWVMLAVRNKENNYEIFLCSFAANRYAAGSVIDFVHKNR